MKLDDLKQKAAARQFQENQIRVDREKHADERRGEFQRAQQSEQVKGAIEQLQNSRQVLENFKQRLEEFTVQARQLQGKKGTGQKRLGEIYGKINEILQDPDIKTELAGMGKNIQQAEQLVADADFAEQEGVSEALKIQNLINEIEQQVTVLEQDERQLHSEIQSRLSGKQPSSEFMTARAETQQLLEAQLKQLEEDLKVLELDTPEEAKKAEVELENALPIREPSLIMDRQDQLAAQATSYNPFDGNGNILAYKDILGEVKFTETLQAAYGKQLDVYATWYKHCTELDKWERDFKTADEYLVQVKEAETTIKKLWEKKTELSEHLEKFFLSEQGKPVLIEIIKRAAVNDFWDQVKREGKGYRGSPTAEQQRELERNLKITEEDINKHLLAYAQIHSSILVKELGVVADDFVVNKQYRRGGTNEEVPIVDDLSSRVSGAIKNYRDNNYDKLPDMGKILDWVKHTEAFYQRLAQETQHPKTFAALVKFVSAARAYVHTDLPYGGEALRTALEHNYLGDYWYKLLGEESYKKIDELTKLFPQFEADKIGQVKFETADFTAVQKQGENEATRDRVARKLKELNEYIEKLRAVVWKKAEYDIANAEIVAFERSSKHGEVKGREALVKQQELVKQLLPEMIALQQAVDGKRQITINKRYFGEGVTAIHINDVKFETLDQLHRELDQELKGKELKLNNLQLEGRPSLLSGKRGAWDNKITQLKEEIAELKTEVEKVKNAQSDLQPVASGLAKLGQLLTQLAQELPDDYDALRIGEATTAGQVFEKLNQFTHDIGGKQPGGEQIEFARDYKTLQEKAEMLKASIEKLVTQSGLRNVRV